MPGCMASKHQGAQESVYFVKIGLNQPFGKLRVTGANFVEFTIEDCELAAERSAIRTLMMEAASNHRSNGNASSNMCTSYSPRVARLVRDDTDAYLFSWTCCVHKL